MNDGQRREIDSLLSALCDGTIETQQLARLDEMLCGSAECRRVYLQYIDMHARLTAHPNLATGIPVERVESASPSRDDTVVLELARVSLDHFTNEAERTRKRRQLAFAGRWLTLALVVLVAVIGWRYYDHWQVDDHLQSSHSQPVIREVIGEATVETSNSSSHVQVGQRLHRGDRLRLGNDDARALLVYDDGTKIVVYFNSAIEVPTGASDVQLKLISGTMQVDAAPQPKDQPLVFATDHARYVVLGTRFRLYRGAVASRLELDEGTVRLERQVDGKKTDVTAGYVAIANSERAPIEIQPLATGRSQLRATFPKAGQAVAFSSKGNLLATSDWQRGLKTWKPDEAAPSHMYESKVGRSSGLVFAGETLVQVNSNGKSGVVTLWQPDETNARTISLPGKNARSRALSPDGFYVAESDDDGTHVYRIDPAMAQRKRMAELPSKGKAWCLSLSQSAQFAAAGFWDGTVRVYQVPPNEDRNPDLGDGIVFEKKLKHTPTQIALAADASLLAVFTHKDGLLLIDLATGQQRSLWAGGAASVASLKFTSDGKRLMAGLSDRTVRMWSIADGSALIVIDTGHVPHGIVWLPEASLLATAGGQVKLWECQIP